MNSTRAASDTSRRRPTLMLRSRRVPISSKAVERPMRRRSITSSTVFSRALTPCAVASMFAPVLIWYKIDNKCVRGAFLHSCSNPRKYGVICVVMTQDWVEGLHRRIAAAIKSARANRPAQWLADETERLGYPISRAAIANYESGRKKSLDIAELLVLAAALRLPPVTLLFPQLPDGPVEVLPSIDTTSWDATAWFSGEESSPDDEPWTTSKEYQLLRAVRERREQLLATAQFIELLQRFARTAIDEKRTITPNDPEMRAFSEQVRTLRKQITRLDEVIRETGGVIDDE
jgi:transcriptional regulator with XRE-family HTH domain